MQCWHGTVTTSFGFGDPRNSSKRQRQLCSARRNFGGTASSNRKRNSGNLIREAQSGGEQFRKVCRLASTTVAHRRARTSNDGVASIRPAILVVCI